MIVRFQLRFVALSGFLLLATPPSSFAAGRCDEPRSRTLLNAPLVRVFDLPEEKADDFFLYPTACVRRTGRRVVLGYVSRPRAITVRGTQVALGEVSREDTYGQSLPDTMLVTSRRIGGEGSGYESVLIGGSRNDSGVVRVVLGARDAVAWSTCQTIPEGFSSCLRNGRGGIAVAPRGTFEPFPRGGYTELGATRPEARILALSKDVDPFSLQLTPSGTRITWNERRGGRKVAALPYPGSTD